MLPDPEPVEWRIPNTYITIRVVTARGKNKFLCAYSLGKRLRTDGSWEAYNNHELHQSDYYERLKKACGFETLHEVMACLNISQQMAGHTFFEPTSV
jgi:hypothetical protein